jgi:hypothetical protein
LISTGKLEPQDQHGAGALRTLFLGMLLLALTIAICAPALRNFFTSDDYLLIGWAHDAQNFPDKVWHSFNHPWEMMGGAKYYRPLVMVSFYLEYALWGCNAVFFRLGNIFCDVITALILGGIAQRLASAVYKSEGKKFLGVSTWAVAASLIFCAFPLHCEPVNWIVCRIELYATLFSMLALWCHIQWHNDFKPLIISLIAFALALCSKEQALIFPLLIVAYEYFVGADAQFGTEEGSSLRLLAKLKRVLYRSAPYWLTLAGYFVVRRLVLGEFIGGWDPSTAFYHSKFSALEWLRSFQKIFVPLNSHFFSNFSPFQIVWVLSVLGLLFASVYFCHKEPESRKLGWFLISWFLVSLIPPYRFFIIDNHLLNSRFAYMASAPFCLLLMLGLCRAQEQNRRLSKFAFIAFTFFFIECVVASCGNSLAWGSVGDTVTSAKQQLGNFFSTTSKDRPIRMVGLPLESNGVYVFLNGFSAMLRPPFSAESMTDCLPVDGRDRIFPVGFLKSGMEKNLCAYQMLTWNPNSRLLEPFKTGPMGLPQLMIQMHPAENKSEVEIPLADLNCWSTDFFKLTVTCPNQTAPDQTAKLFFKTNLVPGFTPWDYADSTLHEIVPNQYQGIFALRGLPDWAYGGRCSGLKLRFDKTFAPISISLIGISPQSIMPEISILHDHAAESTGIIHLSSSAPSALLAYDTRQINNSSGAILEVCQIPIQNPNSSSPSPGILLRKKSMQKMGTFQLEKKDFPGPGTYTARIRAVAQNSQPVGVCSDHVEFSLESTGN